MSAQRRPAVRGERAVLIMPRDDYASRDASRVETALDAIAREGWHLVAVLDPAEYLQAHRMVADGLVDVIVAARPEYLPSLRYAADLTPRDRQGRTRVLPRQAAPGLTVAQPRPAAAASFHESVRELLGAAGQAQDIPQPDPVRPRRLRRAPRVA